MFNQNDVRPCWAIRYAGFNTEEVAVGTAADAYVQLRAESLNGMSFSRSADD